MKIERLEVTSPYSPPARAGVAPPVQGGVAPPAGPDAYHPGKTDDGRFFRRVILPVVGLGMATLFSGLASNLATQVAPVQTWHAQNLAAPHIASAGNRWTIVRLTYYSDDLNQDMFEGVDGRRPVVSGQLSEDGQVAIRYQVEDGKQVKTAANTDVATFIRDAAKQYPADHIMVIVDGHSHNIRHLVPLLAEQMKQAGHVDILDLDSCSMGQADVAWQFRDSADYLLASQAYGMLNPRMARVAAYIHEHPDSSPRDVASAAAATKDQQRTSAVLDLHQLEPMRVPMQQFSAQVQQLDAQGVAEFRNAAKSSQQFARNLPWDDSPAIDVQDLARHLSRVPYFKTHHPALVEAAQALATSARAAVTDEYHRAGYGVYGMQMLYEHISRPGGMSLLVPLDGEFPGHSTLHDFLYNKDLDFWSDTGWDKAMAHLAGRA